MNDNSKILIGFLAGAVAGTLAGMLLAPDQGSEIRRKIVNQIIGFGDTLNEKAGEVMETMSNYKEQMEKEFTT